ncbi:hypothetical protein INT48_004113 [Thamnidium elegans]|uniref:USP domain-containing protein n=1 Tax=Thamnidium elegans TaxID=101142 RepID=A0A8H7SPI0_9FUNG|nr:hypothetical protein INT48_004113 [Thamnidium elegans]
MFHFFFPITPPTDSSSWSVIPFKEPELPINTAINKTTLSTDESSLTWWKDPENPSDRIALDDLPIGLRPPSYNFAYSPVILQALFHVTAFQHAVLSFRPASHSWGAPSNYWKGFGEAVPGYVMREVVTKRQVVTHAPPKTPPAAEENLISFDDSPTQTSSDEINETINENIIQEDLPPRIVETTSPIEETVEFVDVVDNELQLMPKCLSALAEMQKLFAFLGNSKRLYGSSSHYVRALSTKLKSRNWEFNDKTFEAFLELMIQCLVEADEQSDNAIDPSYIPVFRSLFLVKARIEYGNDYDNEEIYYLTLGVDTHMNSFHDCLDPLIFESYNIAIDPEADPSISDDEDDEVQYKFTTFKQIPPILIVLLDHRKSSNASTPSDYIVDKTIYMDRYMVEKKDQALQGFREMEVCRKKIMQAKSEMETLKRDSTLSIDKRDVLLHTLDYFEQTHHDQQEELDILKQVLNAVNKKIDSRLTDLEDTVMDQREKIHHVFDRDEMKENPYGLRASLHHDGKSGTGHYWAYIWVEPMEQTLLSDIPVEGGWFKFCDAYVTACTETEVYNERVPPFALMYVSDALPNFTKEELYNCIPDTLKEFIQADNRLFDQEIYAHDHLHNPQESASLISTSDDDVGFTEKTEAQLEYRFADMDISSTDDTNSVGTAVGQTTIEYSEPHHYSFTGQGFNKLKDRVNSKIMEVSTYANDDYRLLMSFEAFLARTQNRLLLEHLYLLYSSEKGEEFIVDEEGSRKDDDLNTIWHIYDTYLAIGEMVTQALSYFVHQDFSSALQCLLDSKRHEAYWKTELLLDMDVSNSFSGLSTISFNRIIEVYGKECLKILNNTAYKKASHESYRTRGLEDAIRIAYQAQTVIGPDNMTDDSEYHSLGSLWLSFAEQPGISSSLTNTHVELLNTLIMIYLEGQSGGSSAGIRSRSDSPAQLSDNEEDDDKNLPLWQKYQLLCSESQQLLQSLNK